jgi:hypothetical protein
MLPTLWRLVAVFFSSIIQPDIEKENNISEKNCYRALRFCQSELIICDTLFTLYIPRHIRVQSSSFR